jgi:hypothetical protein
LLSVQCMRSAWEAGGKDGVKKGAGAAGGEAGVGGGSRLRLAGAGADRSAGGVLERVTKFVSYPLLIATPPLSSKRHE